MIGANPILIVGPGVTPENYDPKIIGLALDKIPVLAYNWGGYEYFHQKVQRQPHLFTWHDPSGAVQPFKHMAKLDKSNLPLLLLYSGIIERVSPASDLCVARHGEDRNGYLRLLDSTLDRQHHVKIPTHTIDANEAKIKLANRFDGSSLPVSTDVNTKARGGENKLTYCILPLLYSLGYRTFYVLGFDGKGDRWHIRGRFWNKPVVGIRHGLWALPMHIEQLDIKVYSLASQAEGSRLTEFGALHMNQETLRSELSDLEPARATDLPGLIKKISIE